MSIVDQIVGYDELWIIGDNFVAETFWNHFLRNTGELFIKQRYEWEVFCKSCHDSKDVNMLSRLRSSLARAISDKVKLAKYIVIVLDDDLVDYLGYVNHKMLGSWVEWLTKMFVNMVNDRKSILPTKVVKNSVPQLYWVAPPHHANLENNNTRTVTINCMESVFKLEDSMRIVRMKELWAYNDHNLIDNKGRFTTHGLDVYWQSIDAAVKFNILKREKYLAKASLMDIPEFQGKRNGNKRKLPYEDRDGMVKFIKRNATKKFPTDNRQGRKLPAPSAYKNS